MAQGTEVCDECVGAGLLALVLFGLGFTLKFLWWVALALLIVWLVGMIRPAKGRRFYHWGHS